MVALEQASSNEVCRTFLERRKETCYPEGDCPQWRYPQVDIPSLGVLGPTMGERLSLLDNIIL